MGLLFVILRYIVKRGEEIIETRAQERLLLKEKLNQAERLASLGEMVAAVSHEIRNPLGIISSTAELLKQKRAGTAPQDQLANVIVEEASRLNRIVTDFLNFARPATPTLMPCHVGEILEKNLRFLALNINKTDYKVHKRFATHIPAVQADAGLLYQAFLNILINATETMPQGGSIHIELSAQGNRLMIIFADEGGGIPDENLGKIWEPFFTTKDQGSGLGLPIVKKIIEGHGGTIHIEKGEKKGVQVIVTLPMKPQEAGKGMDS